MYLVESPATIATLSLPLDMGYSQGTPNKITSFPLLSTAEAVLRSPFFKLSKNCWGLFGAVGSP